ncbi:MAG: GWxTD domain-containing protein [Flavobacteriales bacterium]|nr:GWxTD domain-containing protein [Flavobacteriales bacterium]
MKNSGSIFVVISCIMLLMACDSGMNMQSGSYKFLYDYESRELHPEYIIYHHRDDSSTIFFRVKSSELLYARDGSGSPFEAKIRLNVTTTEIGGDRMDTTSVRIVDTAHERQGWLLGSVKMKLPQGIWNVVVEFTDLTKNQTQPGYLIADKTTAYSGQNYLLRKFETGEPIFGGFATPGQIVEVESARNKNKSLPKILHLIGEVKLPPPPFSTSQPELPDLTNSAVVNTSSKTGEMIFEVESGNYFVTHDVFLKSGITIKTSNSYYPEVRSVEALEWPLRYITTKSEHDDIVKNNYPKLMIDKFWLECGGTKERARELIKTYYRRVQEANYYFSTYTEGWRTDRGMIHLIFGNPTKINRYNDAETWQYGEDGSAGMLTFNFHKVEHPLSGNIYVLERDPGFKTFWERGVQNWRNGRVYNE